LKNSCKTDFTKGELYVLICLQDSLRKEISTTNIEDNLQYNNLSSLRGKLLITIKARTQLPKTTMQSIVENQISIFKHTVEGLRENRNALTNTVGYQHAITDVLAVLNQP